MLHLRRRGWQQLLAQPGVLSPQSVSSHTVILNGDGYRPAHTASLLLPRTDSHPAAAAAAAAGAVGSCASGAIILPLSNLTLVSHHSTFSSPTIVNHEA